MVSSGGSIFEWLLLFAAGDSSRLENASSLLGIFTGGSISVGGGVGGEGLLRITAADDAEDFLSFSFSPSASLFFRFRFLVSSLPSVEAFFAFSFLLLW